MTSIYRSNLEIIAVKITDINEISISFVWLINDGMLSDLHFQSNLKVIGQSIGHVKNITRCHLKVNF